jgi:hypothetical protein
MFGGTQPGATVVVGPAVVVGPLVVVDALVVVVALGSRGVDPG